MRATGWLPSLAGGPGWSALADRAGPAARLTRWLPGVVSWPGWPDLAWVLLWTAGLAGIVFEHWETVPFHLIWIAFALIYSFRIRNTRPTMLVLSAMLFTTGAAIALDVLRGARPADELTEVPLMAAIFWIMMWQGRRRMAANAERNAVSEENARLLATQRRFLQDASHQLRTPITIALGHSELLARSLTEQQDRRDIGVIVGELNRLRVLSERLLLIAASANPDFLRPELVAIERFIPDVLWRWRPAADRHWLLGQIDEATAVADTERLALALDALLENAVQHTSPDDVIMLAVVRDDASGLVRLVIQDTGTGIEPDALAQVFERFATGSGEPGRQRGTGLGLALVRAVAEGHGGTVAVQSRPGLGSKFELTLPLDRTASPAAGPALRPARTDRPAEQCRSGQW